jgi:hypothetical protein
MKYEMIESFFDDLADYTRFLLKLKEARRATSNFSCVATLKKEDGKYLYTLEWEDGRWVGEYVRPFRANEEYLRLFHAGCAESARRLRIYLETGDIDQVPKAPPAFGILSCESPDELAPAPPKIDNSGPADKYFPEVRDARLVKQYDGATHKVLLLTDVKCSGIIRCTHLLVAFQKGEKEPSYVVAAEASNLRSPGDDSGPHFLCCYPGSGHINHGCSNEWGNLDCFDRKARELMSKALGIRIT